MYKYRHKDDYLEVTAVQLTADNAEEVAEWCEGYTVEEKDAIHHDQITVGINVPTRDGMKRASEGDYIIKQHNHFLALKPSIFGMMYESII